MINQVTSQLDTSTSDYDIMQTVHNAINDVAQLVNKLNRPGAAQSKETHLAFRSLDVKFNRHLTMFIAVCQKLNLQQRTTDAEIILQVDPAVLQRQVEATTGKTLSASVLLKGVVEYRGRSTLGGGGLKTDYQVFRGRLKSGESVALKTHLQSSKNDGDGVDNVRRIMRQVHLWTSFSSPYILECYGVGMEITMTTKRDSYDDFKLYLVSPYMRNGDAASFVSKRRRLGAHVKLLQLIRDIALGIQYLHHRTPDVVVHASVRGENVLIKDDESACLGGFCLSKVVSLETATALTGNNFQCRWMAPELFRKPRQLAAACDVWSWAMTALELISGQEPYYSIRVDWEVVDALKENQKPERGQHAKFDQYCPLADLVWALMEKCWLAAAERPTIDEVVSELERIEDIYAGQQLTASWS
ncbi:hypothetical protein FRC06_002198 [Ceratobasidium sp. 370]|nr:hypothetical protein FRC06_002198 [Ceratobasidium sp. 370]